MRWDKKYGAFIITSRCVKCNNRECTFRETVIEEQYIGLRCPNYIEKSLTIDAILKRIEDDA